MFIIDWVIIWVGFLEEVECDNFGFGMNNFFIYLGVDNWEGKR